MKWKNFKAIIEQIDVDPETEVCFWTDSGAEGIENIALYDGDCRILRGSKLIPHVKYGEFIAFGNPGDFEGQEHNLDIVDYTEDYDDEEL
jgi:hypothetical protein